MGPIRVIYENGVIRPLVPVDLPEGCEVELRLLRVIGTTPEQGLEAIHAVMDLRYNSGEHDVAKRHNEHQP